MKNIAIITARGGSKRIPKKNIKLFCGKPVISYSIEAAINSKLFDEIMVSTDDKEIAKISLEYGAKVPFYRSEETSNDTATTRDVLVEVISEYKNRGIQFDNMCCIYPVAPFVTKEKLINSYNVLVSNNADSVLPMVSFSVPPQTGFYIRNNEVIPCNKEFTNVRTQDIEEIYYDPGQFYWHKISSFFNEQSSLKQMPFIISELEAQDVDNEIDWIMAELKYNYLNK